MCRKWLLMGSNRMRKMLFQSEEWRNILKWNQRIKKQVWKTDNYVYFLKKVLHIYNFTEDGFVSFSTFQCCAPFWLHSENATLWLKFCQFSFIWFTISLLYSFVNFKIWLAESLFRHSIKIYKPPPFLEYIYIYIYIYERETSVCMCYTITVKQKTQRLFDEFSYSFTWEKVMLKLTFSKFLSRGKL